MKKKRGLKLAIFALGAYLTYQILWFLLMWPTMDDTGIIPLFGLPAVTHRLLIYTICPVVLSMISILVFPRVFAPLYLRLKSIGGKKYKNAYIGRKINIMTPTRWIGRGIMVFLLSMGISSTLMEIGILNPWAFIEPGRWAENAARYGVFIVYQMDVFFGAFCLVSFIVVGLWAIGWSFEDAGLIHYHLPENPMDEFFEVEPVHFRYKTWLTGYAGLSALFFYLGAVYFYVFIPHHLGSYNPADPFDVLRSRVTELFFMFTASLLTPIMLAPAYILYWLVGVNFLRKGLEQTRGITEQEFRKSLVDKTYDGPEK